MNHLIEWIKANGGEIRLNWSYEIWEVAVMDGQTGYCITNHSHEDLEQAALAVWRDLV